MFKIQPPSLRAAAQKEYICLLLILLLSIAIRIFYSSLTDYSGLGPSGQGDQHYYFSTALSIRESTQYLYNGIDSFYRPPLYSYFISLFYSQQDSTWVRNIVFAQSLLTYASSGCFFIALRGIVSFGARLAWLGIWLISPFSFFGDSVSLPESVYTSLLLLVLFLCLLVGNHIKHVFFNYILYALIGALLGVIALTREIFILYPFLLFPTLCYWKGYHFLRSLRLLFVTFILMLLTISPWIVRNYQILPNSPPFISKGISGGSLFTGTWLSGKNEWTNRYNRELPRKAFELTSFDPTFVAAAHKKGDDETLRKVAIDAIVNHPYKVAMNWLTRCVDMWVGTRSDLITLKIPRHTFPWLLLKTSLFLFNFIILIGSFISIVFYVFFQKSRWALLLASLPIYNFFIYLPFYNIETRYSHPALPVLFLFFVLMTRRLLLQRAWKTHPISSH